MQYLERNSLNSILLFLPHDSKVLLSLLREFSKLTSNFCNSNLKSCVCAQKTKRSRLQNIRFVAGLN